MGTSQGLDKRYDLLKARHELHGSKIDKLCVSFSVYVCPFYPYEVHVQLSCSMISYQASDRVVCRDLQVARVGECIIDQT